MVTYIIIGFTAILSIVGFSNHDTLLRLSYIPFRIDKEKEWYRFISHAFVHNDVGHLLFNMLTLFFFGREVERLFTSSTEFILFYLSAVLLAVLPSYNKHKNNEEYVAVGASGAVAAVMFVLVLYAPWEIIYLKFFIPLYYILFAVGYLLYCTYQSRHAKDNVAHDVHLWGSLYGLAYTLLIHPESWSIFIEKIKHPPFL